MFSIPLNASIIESLKAGNKVLLVIDDSIILRKIQDYNNFLTDLIKKFSFPWLIKIIPISPLKSASIVPGEFKTVTPYFRANPDLGLI